MFKAVRLKVQCAKFSLMDFFKSVKTQHTANEYVNKHVDLHYNKCNLVNSVFLPLKRSIETREEEAKVLLSVSCHLAVPLFKEAGRVFREVYLIVTGK